MSSNISKQKRERMMQFLSKLKEEHKDDDSMLIALGEIEAELNAKKYGLVWEEHEEAVDVMMKDNIPVFTECANKEIHASDSDDYNFLLEGDNLHSLRLLEKTHKGKIATVYKGNIIKNLIMDCQSYTKYRPNETTGGIFVSWRRKEELPTGA